MTPHTAFPSPLVWFWTAQSRAGCSCDRRSELFQWLSSHSKLLITVWARHLEKLGYFAFLQLVYMAFLFLCTSVENSASLERQDRSKLMVGSEKGESRLSLIVWQELSKCRCFETPSRRTYANLGLGTAASLFVTRFIANKTQAD